jgi:hypothetical protein
VSLRSGVLQRIHASKTCTTGANDVMIYQRGDSVTPPTALYALVVRLLPACLHPAPFSPPPLDRAYARYVLVSE